MKTTKKPIKKAQRGVAVDNTRVAKKFDINKQLKQEKDAKRLKSDVKKVTRPYTVIAKPDPEAMFPGDSIRYYTGQRGGVGVPYIRDVAGSKGGLLGIDTRTTDAGFARASRDKKNFRTYQDTTAVKANFEPEKKKVGGKVAKAKDGGKVIKKAQKGANLQLKNISKEKSPIEKPVSKVRKTLDSLVNAKPKLPVGLQKKQTGGSIGSKVVNENPRQQKRLSRIKETNPERAAKVEKRMVRRADRAMGARGAASRMKTGGKVAKKK
jgi:hypothetical protein